MIINSFENGKQITVPLHIRNLFSQKIDYLLLDRLNINEQYFLSGSFIIKGFPKYYDAILHNGVIISKKTSLNLSIDFKLNAGIAKNKTQILKFDHKNNTVFVSVDYNSLKLITLSKELLEELKNAYIKIANLFYESNTSIYISDYLTIGLSYNHGQFNPAYIKEYLGENDIAVKISYINDCLIRLNKSIEIIESEISLI